MSIEHNISTKCVLQDDITYAQKFKMQLMVTSVDDNIKYLKNYGAKHHIEMSTEIMYYTKVSSLGAERTVICNGE